MHHLVVVAEIVFTRLISERVIIEQDSVGILENDSSCGRALNFIDRTLGVDIADKRKRDIPAWQLNFLF